MNLENLGVQEMNAQEAMTIEGGSWFSRNWEACCVAACAVWAVVGSIGSNLK